VVIADATPLRHLATIHQIHLLNELYGRINVPHEVWSELQHAAVPQAVRLWIESNPPWVDVRSVSTAQSDESLSHLHEGERKAILLAEELRADLLIIDDQAAWEAARTRGIDTVRTFAILELADERGLIPDFLQTIEDLKHSGFWAAERLWDSMRERHHARMRDRDN
jgi:predicted nucleic acid-binding protein